LTFEAFLHLTRSSALLREGELWDLRDSLATLFYSFIKFIYETTNSCGFSFLQNTKTTQNTLISN